MNKIRYAVLELAHSLVQATPLKTVSKNARNSVMIMQHVMRGLDSAPHRAGPRVP
jgi:hypothetical protein